MILSVTKSFVWTLPGELAAPPGRRQLVKKDRRRRTFLTETVAACPVLRCRLRTAAALSGLSSSSVLRTLFGNVFSKAENSPPDRVLRTAKLYGAICRAQVSRSVRIQSEEGCARRSEGRGQPRKGLRRAEAHAALRRGPRRAVATLTTPLKGFFDCLGGGAF